MKTSLLLLALLITLAAHAAPKTDDEKRAEKLYDLGAQEVYCIATNVHQRVQYKSDFAFEMDKAISAACVVKLSRDPKSALESKLASLAKGTNKHPYSESELKAALALKQKLATEKSAK